MKTEETAEMLALRKAVALTLGWKDVQDKAYTPTGLAMCGSPPSTSFKPWNLGPWNNGRYYVRLYESDPDTEAEMLNWMTGKGFRPCIQNAQDSIICHCISRLPKVCSVSATSDSTRWESKTLAIARAVLMVAEAIKGVPPDA